MRTPADEHDGPRSICKEDLGSSGWRRRGESDLEEREGPSIKAQIGMASNSWQDVPARRPGYRNSTTFYDYVGLPNPAICVALVVRLSLFTASGTHTRAYSCTVMP